MEGGGKKPMFLERASYRQRRLRDVARLMPIVAAILFTLPLIWKLDGNDGLGTADVSIYLFGVWTVMIVIAAVLSRRIRPEPKRDPEAGER